MLRDEAGVRSTRRVELLLMLMSESDELNGENHAYRLIARQALPWFLSSVLYSATVLHQGTL